MNNEDIISAYKDWILSNDWTMFVSLSYRYKISYEIASRDIHRIIKTCRSYDYAIDSYDFFGFIVNSPYRNNHIHYVTNFLPFMGKKKMKYIIDTLSISNITSCDIQEIYDIEGLSEYMTKKWNFNYGEILTNMKGND